MGAHRGWRSRQGRPGVGGAWRRAVWAALPAAVLSLGCGVPGWSGSREAGAEASLQGLLAEWPHEGRTVTIAGFRQADGTTSAETQALDEILLSAAVRAGVETRPDAGVAGSASALDLDWSEESSLPDDWRELPGDLVAGGQLRIEGSWAYLRLVVADPATGRIRRDQGTRISGGALARLVRDRGRRRTGAAAEVARPLEIELHLLVRRDEGGFPERIDFEEGGTLAVEDRIQLRYRARRDCEVFAFLLRSDGSRQTLVGGETTYGGRWYYAPGEDAWHALSEDDMVYTLYFLAAPRIEEDRGSLWEELDQLQAEGMLERFHGLDEVDAAVARLLQRTVSAADTVVISRGAEGVEPGEGERFVYEDGTVFESPGESLQGTVIARAHSALVRYR